MSRGPGLLCSGIGSTSIAESTCCSFWKSVEVGNWKRYKIGDSVVVARRFRRFIVQFIIYDKLHYFYEILLQLGTHCWETTEMGMKYYLNLPRFTIHLP